MLWQGSESLGDESLLFTGILPNGYGPPSGFCWDSTCRDEPIMDDPNMDEYNVDQKVNDFLRSTQQQATAYKTSNLIMTFGSDFQYSNARRWFKNIDKLIYYVNRMQVANSSKVNLFYSTPACYLYSLNKANATWPIKYDDFFPYAHKPHAFWTGYFTSRAALKFNVRKTSRFLQTVRQLVAFAHLKDDVTLKSIGFLERAMGEAQHHDAVSGTEKQHVADDYAKRLWSGTAKCVNVVENSLNAIIKINFNATNKSPIIYCPLLNSTECLPIEDKKTFTIVVYNPLPRSIQSWISLPVLGAKHNITEAVTGKTVISDSSLVYPEIRLIKERKSLADYNLVFKADLPPLGYSLIYLLIKVR
jgi:lysosomal alpha-mannosidase